MSRWPGLEYLGCPSASRCPVSKECRMTLQIVVTWHHDAIMMPPPAHQIFTTPHRRSWVYCCCLPVLSCLFFNHNKSQIENINSILFFANFEAILRIMLLSGCLGSGSQRWEYRVSFKFVTSLINNWYKKGSHSPSHCNLLAAKQTTSGSTTTATAAFGVLGIGSGMGFTHSKHA